MKKPAEPAGTHWGLIGPSLLASHLFVVPSAGHRLEEPMYCLEELGGEAEEGESWGVSAAAQRRYLAEQTALGGDVGSTPATGVVGSLRSQAFAEDLSSLRVELAHLREARAGDQREIQELRTRVKEIEEKLDELLATQDFDAEEAPVDPHARWIEQNLEELRRYPDMFVALDPDRGILVHAADQSEFAEKLESLTPEENERVMLFHTSMYLRG